jgi:hypothetical protein
MLLRLMCSHIGDAKYGRFFFQKTSVLSRTPGRGTHLRDSTLECVEPTAALKISNILA